LIIIESTFKDRKLNIKSRSSSKRQNHAKKQQDKPLPDKIIEKLDKKKARLLKKMEKEEAVKNASKYKKKQNSYQHGLDSLNSQIEDKNVELIKKLKKLPLPEDLEVILKEEEARSKKLEILNKLRKAVSDKSLNNAKDGVEIAKDGETQGGEIHPVFNED
jgi:hypothetical protein